MKSLFIALSLTVSSLSANATDLCEIVFRAPSSNARLPAVSVQVAWNNPLLWNESAKHANDFYIQNAWDSHGGSFVSEIANDGTRLSDTRHLIASSRMIYGLALSSDVEPRYLDYARRQADFLTQKMTSTDARGTYFKAAVDAAGVSKVPQTSLVVNEQAYGLNGLVALYKVTKDPVLFGKIESIYKSFYARFHDPKQKGFFDGFDLTTKKPTSTKSYNSTVYVATSFLVDLAKLPTPHRQQFVKTVEEIADLVSDHFFDAQTGWIIENFTADWQPDWRGWQKQTVDTPEGKRDVTIGVTGHNFQAAWFLMRATEFSEISWQTRAKYRETAKTILTSMLASRAVDRELGGVFDVFQRETGENMWHTNKAWWQQAEAILALTKADTIGLFEDPASRIDARRVRDQILNFYFAHFIDLKNGGEFPTVQRDGTPVTTENKGQLGTATYHQIELARIMKQYAAQHPDELKSWNKKTIDQFFKNYGLIGNWSSFVTEQTKLLQPAMTTVTSDHRGKKTYAGPSGYFDSLGDWSAAFATKPDDFHVEIVHDSPKQVVARLHGTLVLKTPIQGLSEITDAQHEWTEIFSIAPDGSIESLQVLMNLKI